MGERFAILKTSMRSERFLCCLDDSVLKIIVFNELSENNEGGGAFFKHSMEEMQQLGYCFVLE